MEMPIGPLLVISPVKYSFMIPERKVPKTLFIKFGTFCRVNRSTITIKFEVMGHDAMTWSISAVSLKDNAYHELPISKKWKFPKDMSATITVHCHAKDQKNAVAVFYDNEGSGTIILGTKRIPGVLVFDLDFVDNFEDIQENENKILGANEIPGQSKKRRRRVDGIPGLISVICSSDKDRDQWQQLLKTESYSCFEMVSSINQASGEYVLMRMDDSYEICFGKHLDLCREIEEGIYSLRESNGASYVCIDRYPSSILTYLRIARVENLYLNGRWSANHNYMPKFTGTKKSNIVVYTAVMETYDSLYDDFEPEDSVDYVCFTSTRMRSVKNWKVIPISVIDSDPIKTARMYKILTHRFFPDYERSIWMDGNFEIKGGLKELANQSGNLVMMKHDLRDCLYDELQACIDLRKDDKERMIEQIDKYRLEEYPTHNGLVMTGCMVRSHNDPLVIKTMEMWWKEVKTHSCRDQLSFNYVAWKTGIKMGLMSHENVLVNNFNKAAHQRKKKPWQQK